MVMVALALITVVFDEAFVIVSVNVLLAFTAVFGLIETGTRIVCWPSAKVSVVAGIAM